jgi:hypothetical protein
MDIKHIELPSLAGLLVGRRIENRVAKTNTVENTRNGPEDIDVEYIPIQQFARDFYEGQTYAIEIAFSIDGSHASQTHYGLDGKPAPMDATSDFCQFVDELKARFLTSNIKAMMGYVVNQANLYSFKGERLNAARGAFALFGSMPPDQSIESAMSEPSKREAAKALAEQFPKYFTEGEYDISNGRMAPCFKLLEKTVPWSIKASQASTMVSSSIKKFGDRAKSASADNVDWKATMHAVRIVDEGLELLSTGSVRLPLAPEKAQRLLAIRRGEIPLETIKNELETKLDSLKTLEQTSLLPSASPQKAAELDSWLQSWMMRFYRLGQTPSSLPSKDHRP